MVFFTIAKTTMHYANTPIQYTAIFHGCKNVHFQMKISIFFLFLLKTYIDGKRPYRECQKRASQKGRSPSLTSRRVGCTFQHAGQHVTKYVKYCKYFNLYVNSGTTGKTAGLLVLPIDRVTGRYFFNREQKIIKIQITISCC